MTSHLPRFFIPSRHDAEVALHDEPLTHVVDTFVLEQSGRHALDVVVGVTRRGQLGFAHGHDVAQRLTEAARAQLHVHELACPNKRVIAADGLALFALQLVEHITDPANINDPVCLYGTLHSLSLDAPSPQALRGQLTITRGDFLQGFVSARSWAFRYASQLRSESLGMHLMVPAARVEELQQGRGVVLVYPLAPIEVADDDMDNSAIVEQLLADALIAMRVDLERREAERGTLARWFGGSHARALTFPTGATHDALLARAQEALRLLPSWPDARSVALSQRVHAAPHAANHVAPPPRPVHRGGPRIPHEPAGSAPAATRAPATANPDEPPAWMEDFLRDHRTEGAHVQYSAVARAPRAASKSVATSTSAQPDWMSDFTSAPVPPAPTSEPIEDKQNATRPAWMDDFEDE